MKIITSNNKNRITLSKREWISIGEKANWLYEENKKIKQTAKDKFNEIKDRKKKRFWNYLKSQQETFTFFHGTSSDKLQLIEQSGMMTSPKMRGNQGEESRTKGLDQIYYTPRFDYAVNTYSYRESEKDGTYPVLLVLEIPLYLIAEISKAILGEEIYNEGEGYYEIKKIIDLDIDDEEKLNKLKKYLQYAYDSEFTTLKVLPNRFIKKSIVLDQKVERKQLEEAFLDKIGNDIVLLQRLVEGDEDFFYSLPPKMQKNPYIRKSYLNLWVHLVSEDVSEYAGCPEEFEDHPRILDAHFNALIKEFLDGSRKIHYYLYEDYIEDWQGDPEKQSIIKKIFFDDLVKNIKENPNQYKDNPRLYEDLPEEFKNHPKIIEILPEELKRKDNLEEPEEPVIAKNKNRTIWSSYFNDNYIGKIN